MSNSHSNTPLDKVKSRLGNLVSISRRQSGNLLADRSIEALALKAILDLEEQNAHLEAAGMEGVETAENLAAMCAQLNEKLAAIQQALLGKGLQAFGQPLDDLFNGNDWGPITDQPDYQFALAMTQRRAIATFSANLVDAIKPENGGPGFGNLTEQQIVDYTFACLDALSGADEREADL